VQGFRWDDLRVFLALFRARTLSGAAERLGVNASTVGRRIDALEQALGARLFDRTPDGAMPTAAGEDLIHVAEQVETATTAVSGAVDGFETTVEGLVRITAPPGAADHFVAPSVRGLLKRYPRLRIELDSSVGYADLTRREADIALRVSRPASGDLIARKLGEFEYAILASPALARQIGALQDPGDASWITWGHDLAHIPSGRWAERAVPADRVVLRTSSINAQLAALKARVGVALFPISYAATHRLAIVPIRCELPPFPSDELWLVGHRALRAVPRIAAVWNHVLEESERLLG
jgi:DNA-binding transcriptional LysR family regulator